MIRDRIKELRRVKASELVPSPRNWREHPQTQVDALSGVLEEIGYADALLARELPDGHLELIDGHCRREISPDEEVPVLILDLDEHEAAKLMTVLDPLAAMAEANPDALGALIGEIETDSDALRAMLDDLAESAGMFAADEIDMPGLPSGDRDPIQQMTFTLADNQAAEVKRAMAVAKQAGPFVDTGNENSNGNALARIVEGYLGTC